MHCLNIFLIYVLEHDPDNYKMFCFAVSSSGGSRTLMEMSTLVWEKYNARLLQNQDS